MCAMVKKQNQHNYCYQICKIVEILQTIEKHINYIECWIWNNCGVIDHMQFDLTKIYLFTLISMLSMKRASWVHLFICQRPTLVQSKMGRLREHLPCCLMKRTIKNKQMQQFSLVLSFLRYNMWVSFLFFNYFLYFDEND